MTTTYFEKPEKICAEKSFTEVRYRPTADVCLKWEVNTFYPACLAADTCNADAKITNWIKDLKQE